MSAPPPDSQQYTTPRRGHARLPSNAPPLQYTPEAYQQPPQPYASNPPQFNLHQATPGQQPVSQPASVLPSNAGMSNVPGSLQPGAGANVRATSSSSTAPGSATNMQPLPIQTNAQQYAQSSQPPSRSNTHHSHSRSSPAGMDGLSSTGQKYIPFNQTPNQTPLSSNPKAFNAMSSGNPSGGTSHSPLNLTDIRSRTISDAQEPAMGTNMMYSYNDAPTNSNYMAPFATYAFGPYKEVEAVLERWQWEATWKTRITSFRFWTRT
jgi:WD repeat-containing protein 68